MSSSLNSSSSSDAGALQHGPQAPEHGPLSDVVCRVDVVLGSGKMSVRECLQLRRHSIVRLTQSAGSNLQVIVNGMLVAHGEVVIVDDSTAIRITEIQPPPSAESKS